MATAHLKTDLPDVVVTKKDYEYCKKQINKNPTFPYSKIETDRQWKVHACFESCKPDESKLDATELAAYKKAFKVDKRPVCQDSWKKGDVLDVY